MQQQSHGSRRPVPEPPAGTVTIAAGPTIDVGNPGGAGSLIGRRGVTDWGHWLLIGWVGRTVRAAG